VPRQKQKLQPRLRLQKERKARKAKRVAMTQTTLSMDSLWILTKKKKAVKRKAKLKLRKKVVLKKANELEE